MTASPLDLSGRRILITGASSGIGRAAAILVSELGASVVLVGRRADALEETESSMRGEGHRVEPFDLGLVAEIPSWLKGVAGRVGDLAGLVHCAGIHAFTPLRVFSEAKLDEIMRINLGAAVALAKGYRQKGVRATAGASMVLVSSVMGLVGQAGVSAYAASKGALLALCKSLALELADEGIRINCVAPGYVESEMTEKHRRALTSEQFAAVRAMHPLGIGKPADVANAIAFLLADTANWITGATLVVDGGYTAQ